MAGRRGQQQQGFAEDVELKLGVGVVAEDVGAAGISGQPQRAFVGHRAAVKRVGGLEVGPVGQKPLGDEADGIVEQLVRPVENDGLAGVALVADPHVAVVVVAALLGALGQTHRRRGDHAPAGVGQPAQHGVGMAGITDRDAGAQRGNSCPPIIFGARPQGVGVGKRRRRMGSSDSSTTTSWQVPRAP